MLAKKYSNGVEIVSLKLDSLKARLKKIASKIQRDHSEVKQVILFGSFARENFTPYSDVDIALIVTTTDKDFIKRQDDFIDYFISVPLDINVAVYTVQEVEKMSKEGNAFIKEILKGFPL